MVWIILGVLILLFPIVATLYNDYRLEQVARGYEDSVHRIEPSHRVEQYLAEARAYNKALAAQGHHARPPQSDQPGWQEYLGTLDAPETHQIMARVSIPSIAVDLPVYHGTSAEVLYKGAGHMFGSDLPVGGPGTTSVITAHTGMVDAPMFDNLIRIKQGATIDVHVMDQRLRYQVVARQVVGPHDAEAITYEPGKDKLVLVTCTPYGLNTDRLLVEAIRVPLPPDAVDDAPPWRPVLSWWMILDLLVVLAVLLVLWRRRRRDQRDA